MEKNTEEIIKNLTKYFIFYPMYCNDYIKSLLPMRTAECTKLNSFINRKYAMVRFYRLLLCLLFVSFNAAAYSGPKGLYTLEYPVNMPDVSVISENGMPIRIPSLRNDLTMTKAS